MFLSDHLKIMKPPFPSLEIRKPPRLIEIKKFDYLIMPLIVTEMKTLESYYPNTLTPVIMPVLQQFMQATKFSLQVQSPFPCLEH